MNTRQENMIRNMSARQIESMKSDDNFMQFLRILVEKHGNFSTLDIKKCGMSFEYFLRFSRYKSEDLCTMAAALLERIG